MVGRADMNEFWKDVVVGKGNDMRAPAGIIYGYISKLDFFISFASSSLSLLPSYEYVPES